MSVTPINGMSNRGHAFAPRRLPPNYASVGHITSCSCRVVETGVVSVSLTSSDGTIVIPFTAVATRGSVFR
jgi:hypothetical protein